MAKITNVVSTANLNCVLDLSYISSVAAKCQYLPREFSGLLLRRTKPFKSHCQLYANGKITINGGRSKTDSLLLLRKYVRVLKKLGITARPSGFKVVNMIATADLGRPIDLRALATQHKLIFEPELFPGLAIKQTGCTAVLFRTGKVNFLGGKTELDIHAAHLGIELLIE